MHVGGLARRVQLGQWVNLVLGVAVLLLAWKAVTKDVEVRLVPEGLQEEVTVSRNKADTGYRTAYALSLAELIGNVTAGNADFVLKSIEERFAPNAYRPLQTAVHELVALLDRNEATVAFKPQGIEDEPGTRKTFVAGKQTLSGPSGSAEQNAYTYEFVIEMRRGLPWVTHFDGYPGPARTEKYLASHPPKPEKEKDQ